MFGKRFTLFRLLGFEVKADFSWLIIGALITWSLAEGLFPSRYQGLSTRLYWWMGLAGALVLFASIVFHELSHSLVARRFGLEIKGITLFIFGGVAEMEGEPKSARAEFFMAVAGPLASVALAVGFAAAYVGLRGGAIPVGIVGVVWYGSVINWLLAAFNLVPAYPLDGGRVLRSILWHWKRNLRWATRVASRIGSGFGMALVLLGVWNILSGALIGGLWQFMIGMFLRNASMTSYRQLFIRQALEGEPVRRLMVSDPVTVPPGTSVEELVEQYVYRYHHKMFPVVGEGRLKGCVTTRMIRELPREEWPRKTAGEISAPCSPGNTIGPDADAVEALALMNKTGTSRIMVVQEGRLLGVITLKDIMSFLSVRLDLEGGGPEFREGPWDR